MYRKKKNKKKYKSTFQTRTTFRTTLYTFSLVNFNIIRLLCFNAMTHFFRIFNHFLSLVAVL